jgi:hypothetical protein
MSRDKRRIAFAFPDAGARAIAELQDEYAPKTCAAIWQALATPIESFAFQSSWAGSEVWFDLPADSWVGDPAAVPSFPTGSGENLTWVPAAGTVTWTYFPPFYRHFQPPASLECAISYATSYQPGSMLLGGGGFIPRNIFAMITEGLAEFSVVCEACRSEGKKRLVMSRIG